MIEVDHHLQLPLEEQFKKKPYIHYSSDATIAAVLQNGLISYSAARDQGQDKLIVPNRYQGDRSICLTDVAKWASENNLSFSPSETYEVALGKKDTEAASIYHRGGICLLINASTPVTDSRPSDGKDYGDEGHYTGGMPGEVVAEHTIPPSKIDGVVITKHYIEKTGSVLEQFEQKSVNIPLKFHLIDHYGPELTLLNGFKKINREDFQVLERFNALGTEFNRISALAQPDPYRMSFTNIVRQNYVKHAEGESLGDAILRLQHEGNTYESDILQEVLDAERAFPELEQEFAQQYMMFVEMLRKKLLGLCNEFQCSSYLDFVYYTARSRHIPIYDTRNKGRAAHV